MNKKCPWISGLIGMVSLTALTGLATAEITVATGRSTMLYGIKAATVTGALGQAHGRHLAWTGNGALSWDISVPADGRYELYLTADVHEGARGQVFTFKTPDKEFDFKLEPTTGMTLIGRRFQRRVLSSGIDLKKGTQTVEFFVEDVPGKGALLDFRSLELLPLYAKERIAAEYERAVASRASVDWLRDAGYGLMFHWTSQSVQPDGSRKPFAEAVNDFDVDQFVNMVEETGAGYVIFTIGHAESYCPAPIKSWENVHPGKTTERDLINEIASELAKRHIRLICYINGPLGFKFDVKRGGSGRDREVFVENFQNILVEMGHRYKEKVVGYWFDSWNRIFEEFPDVPFETFFQAAKAGNPDRIFCLNSWVYPPVTPWQDYWAGEVRSPVALPVDGMPESGPVTDLPYQALLIMEPYWVQQKATMPDPLLAADDLSEYILNCMKNKGAVTVNLGIYQDGTVGEKALQVRRDVKEKVRGYRLKRKKIPQQARAAREVKRYKYLETGGERKLEVLYKQAGGKALHLDVYYPTANRTEKSPVIVFTHGGGWAAGNRYKVANGAFGPVFQKLVKEGFAVASVSYRLAKKERNVAIRDCVIDCKDAIRYLAKHSDSLGIDPMRVYIMGDSAGGQIAQMLLLASPESLPGDPALADVSYRMVAGVSWYGPCDFEKVSLFNHDDRPNFYNRFTGRLMSSDSGPQEELTRTREMSPINYLTRTSPPLLIIQGGKDTTIPVEHAYYMQEKAKALKAPVEIMIIKNAGHNWRRVDADIEPSRAVINERTVQFFLEHL